MMHRGLLNVLFRTKLGRVHFWVAIFLIVPFRFVAIGGALEDETSALFHGHLSNGETEEASRLLHTYLKKAKVDLIKSGAPTPVARPGTNSIFVPPWDRFLSQLIHDAKEDEFASLCEVIGTLFSDDVKGGGYHLSDLVEKMGRKLRGRYVLEPRPFAEKFLAEFELLSPAGQSLMGTALMVDLPQSKGFAYLRQVSRPFKELGGSRLLIDGLLIGEIIRESRDLYFQLEPDPLSWPLARYDNQIMKVIGDKNLPVMIRSAAGNKLLFESPGLINCPAFAKELYELNRDLEVNYSTTPVRWWRNHLHSRTAQYCGDPDIIAMAAAHIAEWVDERLEHPAPGFPDASLGSRDLGEVLKVLSMADQDDLAREIAGRYVTEHHRLNPDLFLTLVEIGDLQGALKMLPAKDEQLVPWNGGRLRFKLIERLPDFYEAMNNPTLQFQIETGMVGLMTDAEGAFRPDRGNGAGRADLLFPLMDEMKNLDLEQRYVAIGYLVKNPSLVANYADRFESFGLDFTLLQLYDGAVPGKWAFYHRTNCWILRLACAYYREDWELCQQMNRELVELAESNFSRECGGLVTKILGRLNPLVLDQILLKRKSDLNAAAQFWRDFCVTITPMNQVTDWTSRTRAFNYAQLLGVKTGSYDTFEKWLEGLPEGKSDVFRDVRRPAGGYPLLFAMISNDPRWSQGVDSGGAFKQMVLNEYFSDFSLLEKEYGDWKTLKEYFQRVFTEVDVLTYIHDDTAPLHSRAYWVAAWSQFRKDDKEGFRDRVALCKGYLSRLPDDEKHAVLKEMLKLAIAEDEARWGDKNAARILLDEIGEATYQDWKNDILERRLR